MTNLIETFLEDLETPIHNAKPYREAKRLGYVFDPDKINLSYSRLNTLKTCSRKFLIRELHQNQQQTKSVHMAYGSALGAGIQELFNSNSIERAYLAALSAWDYPYWEDEWDPKRNDSKSLVSCLCSIQVFYENIFPAIYAEYTLAVFPDGKKGIELFVYMDIAESYNYQIHVDLILQNRQTGALVVTEIKTAGKEHHVADWQNSNQTLGYYVLVESICRRYNLPFEFKIIYLTQWCGRYHMPEDNYGFRVFMFEQQGDVAATFVKNLLADIHFIEYCIQLGHFPKNGNACRTYNRDCELFGMCDMESMQQPQDNGTVYESLTLDDVDYRIDLRELVDKVEVIHED